MKKLTRLTFLMLLLLTLKTNVSLGKNTSQIIMPINDDLPYIDVYNMDNSIASPKYSSYQSDYFLPYTYNKFPLYAPYTPLIPPDLVPRFLSFLFYSTQYQTK